MRVKSNGIIYKSGVFMHYLHIHPGIITVCMLVLSNVFIADIARKMLLFAAFVYVSESLYDST